MHDFHCAEAIVGYEFVRIFFILAGVVKYGKPIPFLIYTL